MEFSGAARRRVRAHLGEGARGGVVQPEQRGRERLAHSQHHRLLEQRRVAASKRASDLAAGNLLAVLQLEDAVDAAVDLEAVRGPEAEIAGAKNPSARRTCGGSLPDRRDSPRSLAARAPALRRRRAIPPASTASSSTSVPGAAARPVAPARRSPKPVNVASGLVSVRPQPSWTGMFASSKNR